MIAILKKEFKSFFITPIGYIFSAVFLIMSGALFWLFVLSDRTTDCAGFFLMQLFTFIIIVPILTMRLFSEEKKMKTDISLLTAPVGVPQIVFGKFFAAFALFLVTFAVSCIPCLITYLYGTPNTAALLSNMLGIIFAGAAFISIGLFISSLTENQFVAAIITIFVIIFALVMSFVGSIISSYAVRFVIDWFSFYSRYFTFTESMLSIPSIVYFLSITVVFNFLTVRVCESRRWK